MQLFPHGLPVLQRTQHPPGGGLVGVVGAAVATAVHCTRAVSPFGSCAAANSVLAPAAGPSRQLPTVAIPRASVTVSSPVREPPPAVMLNPTGAPTTGRPAASRSSAAGAIGTGDPTGAD